MKKLAQETIIICMAFYLIVAFLLADFGWGLGVFDWSMISRGFLLVWLLWFLTFGNWLLRELIKMARA